MAVEEGNMRGIAAKAGTGVVIFLICAGCLAASPQAAPANQPSGVKAESQDYAGSYYHFMLARRYEELAGIYNRPEDVERAIAEFKLAIAGDPGSLYLRVQLGNLDWRAGRIADAVSEADYVLKKDPNYLDAHRLLGDIYLHDLGQTQGQLQQEQSLGKAIHEYQAITRLDPDDTHAAVLLGRLYWLNNDPAKAEASFKSVLGSHPDSASALSYLGKLLMDQEQYRQALAILEKVPENQRSPSTLAMLGLAYSETGSIDKAIASYKEALSIDPDNSDVRRQYADALMRNGKLDVARAQFLEVVKMNPQDGLTHLRLAQLDQAEGQFGTAAKELAQARTLLPDDPEVNFQDALLQYATGHNDQAIELLQGLLKSTQKNDGRYSAGEASNRAAFLEHLGIIYRSERKYPEALAAFRQIVALGGEQGPRGEGLIVATLQLAGQRAKALEEVQKALQKYPRNRSLTLIEASLLGSQGQPQEAVKHLRAIERTSGADPQIELAIAQVYSGAKEYRKALDVVKGVLSSGELKPGDQENAEFMLGAIYDRQKKYAQAEEQFKKVLASDPLNADAFNYLGYMLADRGVELDQSVSYIKKALEIEPQNAAFLDSLGWAYYKMARYDLALPPLEKAAKKLATDPTVLDHLGSVYLKLGKDKEAAEAWRLALKQWPTSPDTDFTAAQAARLQKRLSQIEHQLAKNESKD
ncbi:MAG: tetratricopeptide repeat protein [Acidobacteriota bacterium]|nr:tetratricopeptide repeat protein [Acidobacteriota bacterium]